MFRFFNRSTAIWDTRSLESFKIIVSGPENIIHIDFISRAWSATIYQRLLNVIDYEMAEPELHSVRWLLGVSVSLLQKLERIDNLQAPNSREYMCLLLLQMELILHWFRCSSPDQDKMRNHCWTLKIVRSTRARPISGELIFKTDWHSLSGLESLSSPVESVDYLYTTHFELVVLKYQ